MSYTLENDGSRRYSLNAKREIVSPKDGQDFYVDRVSSRLGRLAVVRGRIFHPVDTPNDPVRVQIENGWSAPAAAYYGGAAKMASRGVAAAIYDTYHPPVGADIKDPLRGAEMGGMEMLDIFEDIAGDSELALVGHSTGALTAWRMALRDERVSYVVGEAPVGLEHHEMYKAYLQNLPGMSKELYNYIMSLRKDKFGWDVLREFFTLNATDPSRLVRQVWMLGKGPDLAPLLDEAHQRDILNGLILLKDDMFFKYHKQAAVLERKRHLFDAVRTVEGAQHLYPNRHPAGSAEVRLSVLDELRRLKRLGKTAVDAPAV